MSLLVEPGEGRLRDAVDSDLTRIRTEGPSSCPWHTCSQVDLLSSNPDDEFFSVIALGAKLVFGTDTSVPTPQRCYTSERLRYGKFRATRITELPSDDKVERKPPKFLRGLVAAIV